MNRKILISILIAISAVFHLYAQLQVGDPDVTFDRSKFDPDYPQMEKWITAGVRGGIPYIDKLDIKKTLNGGINSSAINSAINEVANQGDGAILLKNGTYTINAQVTMKNKVYLIGESRTGVTCTITMTGGDAFRFYQIKNSGIYRLTIQGAWGAPKYDWNIGSDANKELPNNTNYSVKIKESTDCFLDKVDILNSGLHPMKCNATYCTFRSLKVDGCHNKGGGCQGYFFLANGYNLVTGCFITHIRHISLQGGNVEYNVVYDNNIEQEISFHSGDNGNNLIERNTITLPTDMPPGGPYGGPNYCAIMGPWSIQHELSKNPNFLYKNNCLEKQQNNATPWSDNSKIYSGPIKVKPPDPHTNFPSRPNDKVPTGGTLYPVVLGGTPVIKTIPQVKLRNPEPVTVSIYTLKGRLLKTERCVRVPVDHSWVKSKLGVKSAGLYIMHIAGKGMSPVKQIIY